MMNIGFLEIRATNQGFFRDVSVDYSLLGRMDWIVLARMMINRSLVLRVTSYLYLDQVL